MGGLMNLLVSLKEVDKLVCVFYTAVVPWCIVEILVMIGPAVPYFRWAEGSPVHTQRGRAVCR
jgi:hypothetical protein